MNIKEAAAKTSAITANDAATGPCKDSAICNKGCSQGKPEPLIAAKAFLDITVNRIVMIVTFFMISPPLSSFHPPEHFLVEN
jgi:hypothetical protein